MIAIGLLTAAIIVCTQVFYYQAADFSKKDVKTEQEESSDHSLYLSAPSNSILSTSHVELNNEFTFVFEVLLNAEQNEGNHAPLPLALGKLFQTLFNVIIAPNAP
jgi:hypothetical protein